jgi:hypothetical protein
MGRRKKIENKEVSMTQELQVAPVQPLQEAEVEAFRQELDVIRSELQKARAEMKELEEKKKELVALPRRELSAEEQEIKDRQIAGFAKGDALRDKIAAQKAFDNVKVTGRFMNRRAPGNQAKLTYMKYADDPVKWYTFEDGKTYTIPRGFADQINEHYYRPIFIQKDGELDPSNSSQIHAVDTSNKSYAFVPVSFAA